MYKRIVPLGSLASFPQIVDDVQVFAMNDTRDKLLPFVKQFGVITKSVNGIAQGNELKPTYAHPSGISFTTAGKVIFPENYSVVSASGSSKIVYNLNSVGANSAYQIYIQYNPVLSEPESVTNGFKYPSGTSYTKQDPGYIIAAKPLTSGLLDNQIRIASGLTDGSGYLQNSTFYDARTPLVFDAQALDENVVFLLDRENDTNYKLTLNSGLEVNGVASLHNTSVSGTLTVSTSINVSSTGTGTLSSNYLTLLDNNASSYFTSIIDAGLGYGVLSNNFISTGKLKATSGSTIALYNSSGTFVGNLITTGETPTNPQNLRLYDINGDKYSRSDSIVTFKWNYDDVVLSGVTFGISGLYTHPEGAFVYDNKYTDTSMQRYTTLTENSLAGKYLYFPTTGTSYKIVSNTAASSTVESGLSFFIQLNQGLSVGDAAITNLDPTNGTQPPCRIIDDADGYLLTIERVPRGLAELKDFALKITNYKNTYILPKEYVLDPTFVANLPTDAAYTVKLQAQKKFSYSNSIKLNEDYTVANNEIGFSTDQLFDGSDINTSAFTNPSNSYAKTRFTNTVPFNLAGVLTVRGTAFGFNVSIQGYYDPNVESNNPQDYEIMYTSGSEPNDWSTVNVNNESGEFTRIITESKNFSISTTERRQYHIAVWPRINGSRVAGPLTATVTGGAGGVFPDNGVVADTRFAIRTFAVSGITNNVLDALQAMSPAVSGVLTYGLDPQDVLGQVIEEQSSGNEFRIIDAQWYDANRDKISIDVSAIDGSAATTVSGLCYINTTKAGRRIYKSLEMPIDYQLTSASYIIDAGKGVSSQYPGIIRIYQDGLDTTNSAAVDFIEIESIPSSKNVSLDETVQGNRSGSVTTRTLIIDAFDPDTTNPNNYCNLVGEITVNAIPLIISRDGNRPIPNISV